ncbi:MAG: hypothetical protein WA821_02830 [Anaerolineales bacterium]
MGIKHFWMLELAIVLLVGCSPVTPATSIPATNTPEILPTTTLMPTVKYTTTPTPTTQAYSNNMTRECAEIISKPPSNTQLTGLLMVNPVEIGTPTYLLDLSTENKILLGRSSSYESAISEDGKLVAYWDLNTKSVVIADNSGKKIKVVPDLGERLQPAHWLDNRRLLLNHRRGERDGAYVVSSLIILDVSTGKMQEWLPDYPNLDTWFSPDSWSVASRFLVNPQLTYLVYLREKGGLIMWDIHAKKEVASIFGSHSDDTPWWSPDGTRIVTWASPKLYDSLPYVGGGDLFTMDTTGTMKRLTYFTNTQYASESYPTWSPDGKAIAFMLQTAPDYNTDWSAQELSVLDMETGHVTNLCIQASGGFTWSPDGKYIVINQGFDEQRKQDEAYIVNLENKLAWKIIENEVVEGWMTAP